LEPGQIKTFVNNASKTGNILKILKALRFQRAVNAVSGAQFSNYSIFPVQLIALEDVLNANAEENIIVQYEVERKLGVKCWMKQKKYMLGEYELRT